ncbi:MAG: hypothetical protein KME31_25410 [Tolypothrix carrinoi HA7290-LM1]|nr:hypothetical protein [Tolypothrix carrinoi HA7290-LM1]
MLQRGEPQRGCASTEGTSLRVRHFDGTETDTAEWTHRTALAPQRTGFSAFWSGSLRQAALRLRPVREKLHKS